MKVTNPRPLKTGKQLLRLEMNMIRPTLLIVLFCLILLSCDTIEKSYSISSPDNKIEVTFDVATVSYKITRDGELILEDSKLGVKREDADFSNALEVTAVSPEEDYADSYEMINAKKEKISYKANQRTISTKNKSGDKMNILFLVSNDGVAFRYEFPETSDEIKKITEEVTSFNFIKGTRAWLQPKTEAQTGFEHTNPSYEAHYMMDIETGTPSPTKNGWIYPALFKSKDTWMLITEAALGRTYCGTALRQESPNDEYRINFPQDPEKFTNGTLYPESKLPWQSPWRIIAIGDLKTVAESTLGTDLALPAKKMDSSFIKPGKASWSWVLEKDDSTIYRVQKKYIDYAARMNWQYCLIDANWDKTIGYDSVAMLADYGREKNVGVLLWYNSAGDWNTVKFTPKDKLLTHESRMEEFGKLKAMGIKGIKVDFFAGDGQSMINYYQDILEDAAANQLLVNFHGATLPRGLQRTYPNLMTAEAIYGYEMITFGQEAANQAPSHSVMSALVRNAFDPMDFTPMVLHKIPGIKRVTTSAFELATSVLFLSGIQHYAETPAGMALVPDSVTNFLKGLPNHWEDMKFIDGYPGKFLVVARKSGSKWYVAGISAENNEKLLNLNLDFLKDKKGSLITSGDNSADRPSFGFKSIDFSSSGTMEINLKPNDGFVAVFE